MSIRKTLLTAAVAAFAFAALPALASADIEMDLPENDHFTVSGGETTLTTPASEVKCSSVTGTGEFTNSQTGTLSLLFHGCKASGTNCTSAGQSAGTIATTPGTTFHLVTATDSEKNTKDGILITPPTDGETTEGEIHHFASFKCAFGLVSIEVWGNGIIGEITSPTNEARNSFSMNFETVGGTQKFETTDETGNEDFDLVAYINDPEHTDPQTAGQDGAGSITFTEGEGTLTAK